MVTQEKIHKMHPKGNKIKVYILHCSCILLYSDPINDDTRRSNEQMVIDSYTFHEEHAHHPLKNLARYQALLPSLPSSVPL